MAKHETKLIDEFEMEETIEQDQLSTHGTKLNHEVRRQLEERLEKLPIGAENTDEEYLDRYYDFDD